MEVHPPDHPIRNWRDFLVHMATITLGLLIAIGLEGLVEYQHRRHLLHTAETNLRDELHRNRALLENDEHALALTQHQMEQHLAALKAVKAHHPIVQDPQLHWEWDGPQSAAWDTARDGGAIGLMDYDQGASFALIYTQQKIVNDQAELYVRDLYNGNAPFRGGESPSSLDPETLSRAIATTEFTLTDLGLLRDYSRDLSRIYARAEHL